MIKRIVLSLAAVAALAACGNSQHSVAVTVPVATPVPTLVPTPTPVPHRTPPSAVQPGVPSPDPHYHFVNYFLCPDFPAANQDSYAQGADVICPRGPSLPPIVYHGVINAQSCPYYRGLVLQGQLAPEVTDDPASPCSHLP